MGLWDLWRTLEESNSPGCRTRNPPEGGRWVEAGDAGRRQLVLGPSGLPGEHTHTLVPAPPDMISLLLTPRPQRRVYCFLPHSRIERLPRPFPEGRAVRAPPATGMVAVTPGSPAAGTAPTPSLSHNLSLQSASSELFLPLGRIRTRNPGWKSPAGSPLAPSSPVSPPTEGAEWDWAPGLRSSTRHPAA